MKTSNIKTSYIKHIAYEDGTVAVVDATMEVAAYAEKLSHYDTVMQNQIIENETLSRKEIANLYHVEVETVTKWLWEKNESKLRENIDYKRQSKKKVIFYKKPIYQKLGLI